MPRIALTDRFCARVQPTPDRADYFDADGSGLALRVSPAGIRTWTFFFTSPRDHKRARLTLGRFPAVSLARARALSLEAAALVAQGTDPRDERRQQEAAAVTVAALANQYLELHVRPSLRTASNIEQRLKKNVIPIIGIIKIAELHARDVNRCTDAILSRGKPIEANRVYQITRAMLRWAVEHGNLDRSPLEGKRKPVSDETPRDRALNEQEIRHLWHILPEALEKSIEAQRMIHLALILGQRMGEIAGMRRDEIDFQKRVWSLPAARVKNASAHDVPLPDMAVDIIRDALRDAGAHSQFVFPSPGTDGATPIAAHAVSTAVRRAHAPSADYPMGRFQMKAWKPHDLRRTALTQMAQLGVAPIVIGALANHLSVTKASVTFTHYITYTYAKEKKQALDLWSGKLKAIIEGTNNIVPMPRARP